MPFLKFEAQDSGGRIVTGTLQAESQQDLDAILAKQGLRRVQAQSQPVRQAPAPKPKPVVAAQVSAPKLVRPAVQASVAPAAPVVPLAPVLPKSYGISHSKLFFMFSQMASFTRSGFGPVEGLQRTTQRLHAKHAPMISNMIAGLAGGKSLAEVMSDYPRSFSVDIVNTIKSGEQSGQLPAALDIVAQHEQKHATLLRPIFYFLFMFPLILFMGISIFGIVKASGAAMIRQDENNSSLPAVKTLMQEFVKNAPSYYVWAAVAVLAFVLGVKMLHLPALTRFRHGAPFAIPGFKGRSQNEGVARFSWCLDAMLRAGASPAGAIFTAVQAIPNMVIREAALRNLGSIRENESLSSIMGRSRIVSYEYVDIISNGEMTGTLPNAINMIRENEVRQEEHKSNAHKLTLSLVTTLFMGAVLFCFVVALYRAHYTNLFNVFDRE